MALICTKFSKQERHRTAALCSGHLAILLTIIFIPYDIVGAREPELSGPVDECECNVGELEQFNSFRIYPQIQDIVHKDYFRYFKVDLTKECPYWHDDSTCALKDCSVETCDAEDIPFVVAERLRLGSGFGETEEDAPLETSQPQTSTEESLEPIGELPYYERARTEGIVTSASLQADATSPPAVEQTEASTTNVRPTTTTQAECRVTMATTVQPTLGVSDKALKDRNKTASSTVRSNLGGLKGDEESNNIEQENQASCKKHNRTLGKIDVTISEESLKEFERWRKHDASLQDFCVFDDENSSNASYVDLLLNPERFTGYAGPSANRVWKSIYEENCFKSPQGNVLDLKQMCLEKRVFYRVISGLHASINIHLCAEYYLPKMGRLVLPSEPMWGPNFEEFKNRFSASRTKGEGPRRLRNLYFLYLLELRAIHKASSFLGKAPFYTSNPEDTEDTRQAINRFLATVGEFKSHFNESRMFIGSCQETLKLKEEFRQHFLNISTIMDCVGCDKCRLWGKLQTQGLGTALKILFSDEGLELTRMEIVTLFNSLAKLSNSLIQVENFFRLGKQVSSQDKSGDVRGGASSFLRKKEL
ncbi:ERO1 protein beta-like [Tropilaelaps mercedesae]|uniref:ERO1 protein beta-like n=1 Tax=Tropilaelaps mercedesae TaxID=418985 RepID=A0A1V9XUU3_9ACAR|nr:ERO1 protein beta-like [Tropilaelaps mercedesae]